MYLTRTLEIKGPLLFGDRVNFGFVRSNVKDVSPISPMMQGFTLQIRYPCMVYRAPNPAKNKVFIQNIYDPEKIKILDLGDWKFICGVENVLR